jgi:hypothetical protein
VARRKTGPRWAIERHIRSGKTTGYRRTGWREHCQRDADARIVRSRL